jgi:hypothetical protein
MNNLKSILPYTFMERDRESVSKQKMSSRVRADAMTDPRARWITAKTLPLSYIIDNLISPMSFASKLFSFIIISLFFKVLAFSLYFFV